MIDEAQGRIDYDECGSGSATVLLPGMESVRGNAGSGVHSRPSRAGSKSGDVRQAAAESGSNFTASRRPGQAADEIP